MVSIQHDTKTRPLTEAKAKRRSGISPLEESGHPYTGPSICGSCGAKGRRGSMLARNRNMRIHNLSRYGNLKIQTRGPEGKRSSKGI